MRYPAAIAVSAALVAAAGCSGSDSGGGEPSGSASRPAPGTSSASAFSPAASPSSPGSVKVDKTLTDGLETPWGLAFLPDGSALVGSRDTGKVIRVFSDGSKKSVGGVPGVLPSPQGGEGGLLGLAVAPTYKRDHYVYAYFTAARDNRIARMKYENGRLGSASVIVHGIPEGAIHNGGRIAFGPDGLLYAGTGESHREGLAQDKKSLGGKILRMRPDGSVPPGNPFHSLVYSYGHRNVQGLTWDDKDRLWASEFGQDTWDELNLIKPGGDYGWPNAEGKAHDKKYVDPVAQWHTDVNSPSGVAYADGAVWMAGLRGARLWRVPLHGTTAGKPKAYLTGTYGRLRTVARAQDGSLWLATSNTDGRGTVRHGDDRLLRLNVR